MRYELTEKSALMLDYYYQSAEELEVSDLIDDSDPENTIYDWRQVENPSYNLFHLTFEQKFFDEMWYFRNAPASALHKEPFRRGVLRRSRLPGDGPDLRGRIQLQYAGKPRSGGFKAARSAFASA